MWSHTPEISELFDQNIVAKILRTAVKQLANNNPPTAYPEYVPQTGPDTGRYCLREADFWTCGFFPGCIYALLERLTLHPGACANVPISHVLSQLESLGDSWAEPLHETARRTDAHDMSFMIQPSLRRRWELFHDQRSLDAVLTAAKSLYSRYNPNVGAIRSWDVLTQNDICITSMDDDFLVIVDSMCNLDLLFYAAAHLPAQDRSRLREAAINHARTVKSTLLRVETRPNEGPMYSSFHVANFSPTTGKVKDTRTAQGYGPTSTWARGQAWGILGFAQTYLWTKDIDLLHTAEGMADYFIHRLETSPACVERETKDGRLAGRYVPLWDFDAPVDESGPLRDSSAGVIAANGLLVISSALLGIGEYQRANRYLRYGMRMVEDTLAFSLAREKAAFCRLEVVDTRQGSTFEAILKNATANHNAKDYKRYWDHGLVYADYYLIEFGNRLLKMGLV